MNKLGDTDVGSQDAALLSVLADPTRRAIFNLLLEKPKPVKVIAADMPISQAAVSQHLKIMKTANLLQDIKEGRYHYYSINPKALDWLSWQFGSLRDHAWSILDRGIITDGHETDEDAIDSAMDSWQQIWPDHDPLPFGNILRIRLIANHLQDLAQRTAEKFQLNTVHIQLLATLDRKSPDDVSLEEISKVTFMSISATSRHIRELDSWGYIRLQEEKQMMGAISIEPKGRDLVHNYLASLREDAHSSIYKMPQEDSLKLASLLKPILEDLHQKSTS